jgi:hypothetical protein
MSENTNTNGGEIYRLIGKAIGDIGAITKDKRNPQQGFMYRGIDQVYNALNPVMAKLGLFLTPEILDQKREERQTAKGGALIYTILTIRFTVYAPDGSNVSLSVIGEAMDSGDKSTNKAMSVAMKYAMFQLFCIPTEEMIDPDGETHEVAAKDRDARLKAAAQKGIAAAKADKAASASAQAKPQTQTPTAPATTPAAPMITDAQLKAEVKACESTDALKAVWDKYASALTPAQKAVFTDRKNAIIKAAQEAEIEAIM